MKVLLDTHFLIWLATAPDKITQPEFDLMARRDGPLIVSAISIWELRVKWHALSRSGKSGSAMTPETGLVFAERYGLELAALQAADCAVRVDSPIEHKDPFDQMLLVHANQLGARLLTRDRQLRDHPWALVA